jgi:Peptidase family S41
MMNKVRLCLLLFFLYIFSSRAENSPCQCRVNLDSVLRHIQVNYPGYPLKNTDSKEFDQFLQKAREDADRTILSKECQKVINSFLSWFADGHLGVSYSGDVFKPRQIKAQKTPVWEGLTEEIAKQYIDSLPAKDSLTGIWQGYESFYKALICKSEDGGGYRAFLIETINQNWKPGEVKMEFFPDKKGKMVCTFYASDHKPEHPKFVQRKNILEIKKTTVWNRIYPADDHPESVEAFVSARYKWTQEFRPWNNDAFYVQLQNISAGVKPLIDSLVKEYRKEILSKKILILDLRDNEGGDLTVFESFWPILLNDKAVIYGTTFLCTPFNVAAYTKQIESMKGQIDPQYLDMAREMAAHTGGNWTIQNDTLTPDSNYAFPEKIILLVNRICKSSTEDFILALKPGKRVIIAGERTGGVADFEETVDVMLPCTSLILYHPIGISNRLPFQAIDGQGIMPDILLHSKSKAWQPWVKEVLKVISSKKN